MGLTDREGNRLSTLIKKDIEGMGMEEKSKNSVLVVFSLGWHAQGESRGGGQDFNLDQRKQVWGTKVDLWGSRIEMAVKFVFVDDLEIR